MNEDNLYKRDKVPVKSKFLLCQTTSYNSFHNKQGAYHLDEDSRLITKKQYSSHISYIQPGELGL